MKKIDINENYMYEPTICTSNMNIKCDEGTAYFIYNRYIFIIDIDVIQYEYRHQYQY